MSILKVARMGHPVLREPAQAIAKGAFGNPELQRLVEDMVDTMCEYAGVGLAGPQVHAPLRLFVMQPDPQDEATLRIAINPVITPLEPEEELIEGWEGCLSIPDIHGMVPRHHRVRLEAFDAKGKKYTVELSDFAARVAQHETDHLDGVLFLDRMENFSSLAFGEEFRRYHAPRPQPDDDRDRME